MKKILFLAVMLMVGCKDEKIETPPCRFPFTIEAYEDYGLQMRCVLLNGEKEIRTYQMVYYYLLDSFAHCQPHQTVEFCD